MNGTQTRSKQRQPSGMVGPCGRRLPLCFVRVMVALLIIHMMKWNYCFRFLEDLLLPIKSPMESWAPKAPRNALFPSAVRNGLRAIIAGNHGGQKM